MDDMPGLESWELRVIFVGPQSRQRADSMQRAYKRLGDPKTRAKAREEIGELMQSAEATQFGKVIHA